MEANRKNSRVSFLRFVAALAVLLLGGSGAAIAQEKSAPKVQAPATATKPAEPEAAKAATPQKEESRGGPQEGIKVHGHWTIVVKNADGSVASRNEFENAVTQGGSSVLSNILSRVLTVGSWGVSLGDGLCSVNGNSFSCVIVEPIVSASGAFANLILKAQAPGTGSATVVTLSGSAKTTVSGTVTSVATFVSLCQPTVAPATCAAQGTIPQTLLTQHDLTMSPIPVQANQTIDVTVAISFS